MGIWEDPLVPVWEGHSGQRWGTEKIPWCLCGKGTPGKGWGGVVAAPDRQGLGGAQGGWGALLRGPECQVAKQRGLDPSPLELGTQGLCWSISGARAQVVERWLQTRVEETRPEPQVVLAWPTAAPLMEQRMQSRPLPQPS